MKTYRKIIIIGLSIILVAGIIIGVVINRYINSVDFKDKQFIKKLESGITAYEYGITNEEEYAKFLAENAHILNLPMHIENLIDFNKLKSQYYPNMNLYDAYNDIKGFAYNDLVKILGLKNYNSELYPLTENYVNKFKGKSFLKEVPVYRTENIPVGGSIETKSIVYHYSIQKPSNRVGAEIIDQRGFEARYEMKLDNKGYIDDIIYKGVYEVINKWGEPSTEPVYLDGSCDGIEVRYISFQESEVKDCMKDLFDNMKQMKDIVIGYEKGLNNSNKAIRELYSKYLSDTGSIKTESLYTDKFKSEYKQNLNNIDVNFNNIFIADDNGVELIDLQKQYCQVCAEYDDKYIYYDVYWGVDEDYFLDRIEIKENKVISK